MGRVARHSHVATPPSEREQPFDARQNRPWIHLFLPRSWWRRSGASRGPRGPGSFASPTRAWASGSRSGSSGQSDGEQPRGGLSGSLSFFETNNNLGSLRGMAAALRCGMGARACLGDVPFSCTDQPAGFWLLLPVQDVPGQPGHLPVRGRPPMRHQDRRHQGAPRVVGRPGRVHEWGRLQVPAIRRPHPRPHCPGGPSDQARRGRLGQDMRADGGC